MHVAISLEAARIVDAGELAHVTAVVLTRRHLGDDEGFHLTHDGQPYSVVEAIAGWSLTASHEILESDDEVGERIKGALAQRDALPAPVVAMLEQAERELAVLRAHGDRPLASQKEQFALSIVRSLAPAREELLTARDAPGLEAYEAYGAYEAHDVRWAEALSRTPR